MMKNPLAIAGVAFAIFVVAAIIVLPMMNRPRCSKESTAEGYVGILVTTAMQMADAHQGALPIATEADHAAVMKASESLDDGNSKVQENWKAIPDRFDGLIVGLEMVSQYLHSPYGPVTDDLGDYWIDFGRDISAKRPGVLLGYDRAAYQTHKKVFVAYEDGQTEAVSHERFAELIAALGPGVDVMVPTRAAK